MKGVARARRNERRRPWRASTGVRLQKKRTKLFATHSVLLLFSSSGRRSRAPPFFRVTVRGRPSDTIKHCANAVKRSARTGNGAPTAQVTSSAGPFPQIAVRRPLNFEPVDSVGQWRLGARSMLTSFYSPPSPQLIDRPEGQANILRGHPISCTLKTILETLRDTV